MNKEKNEKTIQIPMSLFLKLCRFHFQHGLYEGLEQEIVNELEVKAKSILKRELYKKSKTANTEEEREKARQEYLDLVGMRNSFRW